MGNYESDRAFHNRRNDNQQYSNRAQYRQYAHDRSEADDSPRNAGTGAVFSWIFQGYSGIDYTFSVDFLRRTRMEKLDLKKQWKQLYDAKAGVITAVDVPPLNYLMVDGQGDPNTSQSYQDAIEALYSLA
jgi:hypothetical protein